MFSIHIETSIQTREKMKNTQELFEELLPLINENKNTNIQVEALSTLSSFLQSNPSFIPLIPAQYKNVVLNLISLIQHKEERVIRQSLTALISLTAVSTKSTAKRIEDSEVALEELEEPANEKVVKLMLSHNIVDKLMNQLILTNSKLKLARDQQEILKYDSIMELLCILLANISTIEQGVSKLLQKKTFADTLDEIRNKEDDVSEDSDEDSDEEEWAQGYYFKKLMEMFLAQKPVYVPWDLNSCLKHTRWIPNIFTNISSVALGRTLFLKDKETENDTNFSEKTGVRFALQNLFPYIKDEDIIKRRGVLCTVRNCLFVKEKHYMIRQTPLLNILLNRLSTQEVISSNTNLDPTLTMNDSFKFREVDPSIIKIISECLVMITATNAGMDQMSTESVYKMLEQELAECEDEEVKGNLNKIILRLNHRLATKNNISGGEDRKSVV